MMTFRTLDGLKVKGKRVLVRVDLNVPIVNGRISDFTRIRRVLPTLHALREGGARVIILSHFGRPKGEFRPALSLAPLVDALQTWLEAPVRFAVDCIGKPAREAVEALGDGEMLLLENLRFHAGEERNDPEFAGQLAALGDLYVNDAFSCSHRAHASVVGVAERLPTAAGRLMQVELEALGSVMENPTPPVAAVVGGSKISTKLGLLEQLMVKTDRLVIGGGMANTFLAAQGHGIGQSLHEAELIPVARRILEQSTRSHCDILLPEDVVAAPELKTGAPCIVVSVDHIPADYRILDIGPRTVARLSDRLAECRTVLWNGPVGAFETSPFDTGTISLARTVAGLTRSGKVRSIAGGGDTVSALAHAGLAEAFTYLSTAGGAFLEWVEGKTLPGIAALEASAAAQQKIA